MNPLPVKNFIDVGIIYFSLESYYKSKSLKTQDLTREFLFKTSKIIF